MITGCSNVSFDEENNKSKQQADYVEDNGTIHIYIYGDSEKINTPSSSLLDYIEYYNESKHLIVCINGKEYVHANVSKQLWNDFKKADSYGSFYTNNLKGNEKYWVVGYDGSNGDKIKCEFIHTQK